MARRYVSEIVGEEYLQWKPGELILISTTTGSGKTWFILHKLLRHAKAQGKHLVYFCNRKFLSLQVQAAARRELLNELGEDEEGLAAYLHIRTYQHTEHVYDYPDIKALDEEGRVLRDQWEVREKDILYYVFDEAFYMVEDAGFNADTHYWWDTAGITKREKSITVFLAATPNPLLLFLQFKKGRGSDLDTLCRDFLARYYINEQSNTERWVRWVDPPYLRLEEEYDRLAFYLNDPRSQFWAYNQRLNIEAQLSAWRKADEEASRNPHSEFLEQVERAYQSPEDLLTRWYRDDSSLAERYAYLDVQYFDDMSKLARRIADSVHENRKLRADAPNRNRWLVFVRKLEDAKGLQTSLRALDCPAVTISSKFTKGYDGSIRKRRSPVRRVFDALIHEERLDCDVLISTSVLDCGFTLRASNVSNLVVCQPGKTSFLQMLGRIRVQDGQRVNLYVQSFSPREVKGHRDVAVKHFLYLVQLSQKDYMIHESLIRNVKGIQNYGLNDFLWKGSISFLPTQTREAVLRKLEKDRDRDKYTYLDRPQRPNEDPPIRVNKLAILHELDQLYYYCVELPVFDGDPYYFLKEQLSWIGKTYDPSRWIDFEETDGDLHTYLEQKSREGQPMDKQAQEEFREQCFLLLRALRNPPEEFLEAKARFSVANGVYPGLSLLNQIFAARGIPYQIAAKQSKKQLRDDQTGEKVTDPETGKPIIDNKTYWTVVSVDLEALRKKTEEQRQTRQWKREERLQKKDADQMKQPEASVEKPEELVHLKTGKSGLVVRVTKIPR